MASTTRRSILTAAIAFAALSATPALADKDPIYTGYFSDVAASGYDVVAYFTEGRPVEGSSDHTVDWMGAEWRFANAEHRALFEADPEAYAPQYGGYCAYAVSKGGTASTVPEAWDITDGKLYLNYSADIQTRWLGNKEEYIRAADGNWPNVLK